MNFYFSFLLYLLLLIPIALFIMWLGEKKIKTRLETLLGSKVSALVRYEKPRKPGIKAFFIAMSLLLITLALARPRWGFEWKDVSRQGVDIMVAIDVSKSMKAQDIDPDRLARAKREVVDLLRILQGDRIGLIVFAGVAFVQCPLTIDYPAVEMFLDHLDTDLIPVQGTAIGDAVRVAVKSLKESESDESSGKALILITDGEDHGSDPLEAAREAENAGVNIYTIGVGAPEGAPVPDETGFVKDESGQIILSKLDDRVLRQISEITGGIYARSVTGDFDLDTVYFSNIKKDLKIGDIHQKREKLWYERFFFFSLAALVLLLLESLWL